MKINIEYIKSIRSAQIPNSSTIVMDCTMTNAQMFNALCQYLEHITGEEWEEWKRQIDEYNG